MDTLLDKSEKIMPSLNPDNFIDNTPLMPSLIMIEINNLSKSFGKLKVLNSVNLSCKQGECIALIGPNGCGKTTLIKSILWMVIPSEGTIKFKEEYISKNFEYRKHIGYMPQIGRYPDNMTIGQVLGMMKDIRNSSDTLDEDLIKAFSIPSLMNKRMGTLSGGTIQKVSAALAFLY